MRHDAGGYDEERTMRLKEIFKTWRDGYVIRQVERLELPAFAPCETVRRRIRFSGRVQRVGFRLEVCELARRLGLTGWCRNLENGDVLAEFQGPENRIRYLVSVMESLVRIRIRRKEITELPVEPEEWDFRRG